MKTNFHMKSFVLGLTFIMRFKATQKWPIEEMNARNRIVSTKIFAFISKNSDHHCKYDSVP